ncbi:protein of unknown function [Tessaracoccus bendigoensis DSM 12906]|uniref:DUF4386 domain-containing protein n=2 Tax=Tessaracoccus TaxID=72763 RepID=A0A1M6JWR7_9ACTN|nr:protein of unknown function [Tessaracoccus bendigoensis DSM 12906]
MRMSVSRTDLTWRTLYLAGAVSAGVFVVLVLVPVTMLFTAPVPPTDGAGILEYIAEHPGVYLTQLVSFVGLAVPAMVVLAALAVALRQVDKSLALIGGLFGVASEIIALALGSSPQSLHGGLVVLSDAYSKASSAERQSLVSAADALIATTNAVSWAGILTAAAILILSITMLRGDFGRVGAILGIVTGLLGIVSEALRPLMGVSYTVYGLLLPTWFGIVGWKLLRMHVQTRSVS